ncbi:MAG: BrnT family toxin [Thermomicrobiales bacterium]
MIVDWDPAKNRSNQRKHGIDFEDAQAVFLDPDRIEVLDDRDYGEERWAVIGTVGRLVVSVIYTNRNGGIRLISARKADPDDEADYYASKAWR